MIYQHSFTVTAPIEVVSDFHQSSSSLGTITPPPVIVQIHQAPVKLKHNDVMDFSLWIGPFPIRWIARIQNPSTLGFIDIQEKGPFAFWSHKHIFVAVVDGKTNIIDEITYTLKKDWFWHFVGKLMVTNLNFLFFYREWKTKRWLSNNINRDNRL